MLLKDIPPILVTYCLDKRLSETKQGASDYLTQQVEHFLHLFTEEGYSQKKAEDELMTIFARAAPALYYASSQKQLEQMINDDFPQFSNKHLTCAEAVETLPAILALSPFSINVEGLLKHTLRSPVSNHMAKSLMQYLGLWHPKTSTSTHQKIFNKMNFDDLSFRKVHYYLMLYADRILKYFSDQPEITNKVFNFIRRSPEIVLPLVSVLPPEQIPNKPLQQKIKRWLAFDGKEITLDEIVTHRYLHPYCGDCSIMEATHDNTLLNKDSKGYYGDYGNAGLIYVNDILIGSLKFSGEKSMVSLRTIKDPEGRYPLVLGGVYALSGEVRNAAETVHREAGSYFSKLHLEKLAVRPLRFLGSYDKDGFSSNREFARKLKKKREQLEIVDKARNNRIK